MTAIIILQIAGALLLGYIIGRNRALIATEVEHCNRSNILHPNEGARLRLFGSSQFWGQNGRAVDIFSVLFIPVYASAYNHSTFYHD